MNPIVLVGLIGIAIHFLQAGVFCITPDKVYSTVEGRIALMSYRPIFF
jgi:hypothetical protein